MDLKPLGQLGPAENYLLINSQKANYADLLKLTLLQLLFEGHLLMEQRGSKKKKKMYLSLGKNRGPVKRYQEPFLKPFKGNPEVEFRLQLFAKAISTDIGGKWSFLFRYMAKTPEFKPFIKPTAFNIFRTYPVLNSNGKQQALKVQECVKHMEKVLYSRRNPPPEEVAQIITMVGSNIFLVHGYEELKWGDLQKHFKKQHRQRPRKGGDDEGDFEDLYELEGFNASDTALLGIVPFIFLDDAFDIDGLFGGMDDFSDFDSGVSMGDSHSGSGCSSCSGCGGCGGCGS